MSELTKITSSLRSVLDEIDTASAAGGSEHLALSTLSAWLGTYQRRIHDITHPAKSLTEDQAACAARQWKEFTNDQRVVDFCEAKRLTLTRGRQWYWCSKQTNKDGTPRLGEVIGLPGSRGTPRITDGVNVWIELLDGTMFLGHQDWFKGDRRVGVATLRKTSLRTGNFAKDNADREKLLAMLMEM